MWQIGGFTLVKLFRLDEKIIFTIFWQKKYASTASVRLLSWQKWSMLLLKVIPKKLFQLWLELCNHPIQCLLAQTSKFFYSNLFDINLENFTFKRFFWCFIIDHFLFFQTWCELWWCDWRCLVPCWAGLKIRKWSSHCHWWWIFHSIIYNWI